MYDSLSYKTILIRKARFLLGLCVTMGLQSKLISVMLHVYSKTCVKWLLKKRLKICFQNQLSLNAGQKYCRMLQGDHSAILSIFIKLPFVIKIFVLSIFEWPF